MKIVDFCQIIQGTLMNKGNLDEINSINIYPVNLFKYDTFFAMDSSKYTTTDGGFGNTCNEDSVFGLGGTQNTLSYINCAISQGATTIVLEENNSISYVQGINYIIVEDVIDALAAYARYIVNHSGVKVIGVTGSTGKTTLAHAITDYLSEIFKVSRTDYIRITYVGLIWHIIHKMPFDTEWLVIEMQTDGIGQLDRLCNIVKLDYAFITNINPAHLQRFKTEECILQEKLAVYRALKEHGKVFINADCDKLKTWFTLNSNSKIIAIGKASCSDMLVDIQQYDKDRIRLSLIHNKHKWLHQEIDLKIHSRQDIVVASFLVAFALLLKLPVKGIAEIISKGSVAPGRLQMFNGINGSTIIVDAYNASLISTSYGIDLLSRHKKKKKILVLGSLLELEQKTEITHRNIGRFIKEVGNISIVLCIGESTLYVLDELTDQEIYKKHVYSYESAVSFLQNINIDNDTIVYIKGSGAMRMEIIALHLLANKSKE